MGKYKTDIEIAQESELYEISRIAKELSVEETELEPYGRYKAKLENKLYERLKDKPDGKLILVTAISPTPAGEGKTTMSIGLADGLRHIGKKSILALREPSLGPVFGIKGGACGGGHAQVVPMEDINLHFTGDFHAIGAADNLLAAILDNHIYQGNELSVDPRTVCWKRAVDMNDRQLRSIVSGLSGTTNGVPREDGFEITVASEIMAVLCLASDMSDLKEKLKRLIVAYTYDGSPVTAGDLKCSGAMAALLKDAIKPNLVQTLEHTPAIIHGGPFANIAHGCNSVRATKLALKLSDYVVTEAGFGADLGAEKFLDIKCRVSGLSPDAVVLVASIRALKHHGGAELSELKNEDLEALRRGFPNLLRHADNLRKVYKLPTIVCINAFPTDTRAEQELLKELCEKEGLKAVLSDAWAKGGEGSSELAKEVVSLCKQSSELSFAYDTSLPIAEKLSELAKNIYHADGAELSMEARKEALRIEKLGKADLPICVAKTQYSFSDDPKLLGAPEHFKLHVRDLKLKQGAGFIVAYTGNIITMPGLPKKPAAELIDVDENGRISGLF